MKKVSEHYPDENMHLFLLHVSHVALEARSQEAAGQTKHLSSISPISLIVSSSC